MLLFLFLLSLQSSVDFAHALNALLLVHHFGLLLARRGSRSGFYYLHFNNLLARFIYCSCICLEKLDDISLKLIPGNVVCLYPSGSCLSSSYFAFLFTPLTVSCKIRCHFYLFGWLIQISVFISGVIIVESHLF